ncbi:glycosyltransferase family 2 protein [Hanstruepera marina]|uniref:glycosyltransferase family 2 protein n=1 Tax=Hanstruepera marina TaxID=2873265 RepID=UPI001CA70AAD|nr:glycosyltransferase family A protein [Hanstruepera marina]
MVFSFLKILQPTHYFSLKRKDGTYILPSYESIPSEVKKVLKSELKYSNDLIRNEDLSWQAINKGLLENAGTINNNYKPSIGDSYIFIKRYFSHFWVLYVLMIRVLSFRNPIKEIKAYTTAKHVNRIKYLENPISHEEYWQTFKSQWIINQPLVTVIIPTLNRYLYLKDVLKDLEKQNYKRFEVIVVDQSEPFQANFYKDFNLDVQVVRQEEKALWLARNTAIKQAKGQYILLFDDDSRVEPDWISNHLKCLEAFNADISSGVSISKVGDKVPEHYNIFRISDQLDTGNAMIKRKVFETIGLFDRQFEKQRMGDGEFGARAFINNFKNISNPKAKRLHLKVGTGGLRDMGSWDAFRTKSFLDPRPIPSVLYYFRRYYGNTAAKYAIFKTVPLSIMPYRFKSHKALKIVGAFLAVLLLPIVVYQVWKSWRLASVKLAEGPKVESLI